MLETLMPLYRITEMKDGAVFKTEAAGERWIPVAEAIPGWELENGLRIGTPSEFKVRVSDK